MKKRKGKCFMFIISGDLGYRFTKGFNSLHKRVLFPSVTRLGSSGRHTDIPSGVGGSLSTDNMCVFYNNEGKEQKLFVGGLALKRPKSCIYPFDQSIFLESTKAFIAALVLMLAPQDQPLCFASGIPLRGPKAKKDHFESYLRGLDFEATIFYDNGKLTRRVKFEDVFLFPQGAGAVLCAFEKHPHLFVRQGNMLGLVDIGGRTTELILFRDDPDGLFFLSDYSDTLDWGMIDVNDMVYEAYNTRTGSYFNDVKIQDLVLNKYIYHDGRYLDFSEEIDKALQKLALYIANEIDREWRGRKHSLKYIILTGGASPDLSKYLRKYLTDFIKIVILDDVLYANAIGFYFAAKRVLKNKYGVKD